MCDLCNGSSKCHLCEGEGFLKKAQHQGQITFYETLPCGGCFGSGLCVACHGRDHAGAMARKEREEVELFLQPVIPASGGTPRTI
jgi:DnaJ-class molecular chaperone